MRLFAGGTTLRFAVFVSLILLASLNAEAFQQDCSVRVPISVRAADAKNTVFLKGLVAENLHVSLNKKPVQTKLIPHDGPHRFVLMLDHSISMGGHWNVALWFAEDFLKRLSQDSKVALIAFDNSPVLSLPLQEPLPALTELRKLATTAPKGVNTDLLKNLEGAIALLAPSSDGDIIYVITDGVDYHNFTATSRVQELLQRSGIRMFFLSLSNEVRMRSQELNSRLILLENLSLESGGDFLALDGTRLLKGAMPTGAMPLLPEMDYQFTLELHPEPSVHKAKLNVQYEDARAPNTRFFVLHPTEIFNACISSSTH